MNSYEGDAGRLSKHKNRCSGRETSFRKRDVQDDYNLVHEEWQETNMRKSGRNQIVSGLQPMSPTGNSKHRFLVYVPRSI